MTAASLQLAAESIETTTPLKSVEDREIELAALERELHHASTLKDSIDELSRDVQRQTSRNLSGNATVAAVTAAQTRLDDAIAAFARIPALNRAIAASRDALDWAKSEERRAFCKSIEAEFIAVFERYKTHSRETFEDYRELTRVSQRYLAVTGRPLLEAWHRELNLPTVTGMLSMRSGFTTGTLE